MKIHNHSEQFDGAWHPVCGRGSDAARAAVCLLRAGLVPSGQPDWHLRQCQLDLEQRIWA